MSALAPLARHAHWALRLAILSVFLYHGLDKLGNLAGFAEMKEMPVAMAFLVGAAEAGGAIAVFVGGFTKDWITRVGALAIMPVMLGAIFMVHWGQWHFMATETHPMGGMQFQVTLLSRGGDRLHRDVRAISPLRRGRSHRPAARCCTTRTTPRWMG